MRTATRRDRLLNLLHRGATTVPAAAQALGVSERTLYRDLSALREAGHAIQSTPGLGGGIRIAPDGRPRPVHFEVAEIVGLALSVALLNATSHRAFAHAAQAGLDRARRALSPERRRTLQKLERRILVGTPATSQVQSSLGPVDHDLLPTFERCFTEARAMHMHYCNAAGVASTRRIECIALILHEPTWYILAWDLTKDAARLFRADRITQPASGPHLDTQHSLQQALPEGLPQPGTAEDLWQRRPVG